MSDAQHTAEPDWPPFRVCVRFSPAEDAFIERARIAGGTLAGIARDASVRFGRHIAKSSVQMALVRLAIQAEADDE